MEITVGFHFSSAGDNRPMAGNRHHWLNRFKWTNQYGRGITRELNLVWFQISLEIFRQANYMEAM